MSTLAYCDFTSELLNRGDFIAVLAITMGCATGMIAIIGGTLSSVIRSRAREHTKREIAAYVAEGTLDPDKAVAILPAGMPKWEMPDLEKMMGKDA